MRTLPTASLGKLLRSEQSYNILAVPVGRRFAPKWRNGRRAGFKIRSTQVGEGSSPSFGSSQVFLFLLRFFVVSGAFFSTWGSGASADKGSRKINLQFSLICSLRNGVAKKILPSSNSRRLILSFSRFGA